MHPEVDDAGYDLVIECNGILRHIQLKASHVGSSTARVPINIQLAKKPSGCVIWILFDSVDLELIQYRWFGGMPGKPLPSLEKAPIAKHTKANSKGIKAERPQIRVLAKGSFTVINDIPALIHKLFGTPPRKQLKH